MKQRSEGQAEAPRLRGKADFTLAFVLRTLERASLCGREQSAGIVEREASVRARLARERGHGKPYDVSPVEIVASFSLPVPGKTGLLLDEDLVTETVARAAGVASRKIDPLKLDMQLITRTLSRPYAERHVVLPLEKGGEQLVLAVANPFDQEIVDAVRQLAGMPVVPVLCSKSDILRSIDHVYGFRRSVAAVADGGFVQSQLGDFEQLVRLSGDRELDASDRPVVAAVEYLMRQAFEQRASDIHIEPRRAGTSVRLRIDGVLHPVYMLPRSVHGPVVSRLKMLSRMDIAEKRRPQDGRIKTERSGREVELRVSTIPTAFGEKMVLRIFDPEALAQDLTSLGFDEQERALFEEWIARPHGMVLVTGPTGSGKTTTLYSALRSVATPDVNVVTIEDPIEMVFEGLNQIQVQPKIDLDFAAAIRHILRQDPDVIMVGEIRDRETAAAAVQAALTGHLVLSTLHTNTASEAVTRLRDLGIEPFLLGSSLLGVMAQRLVRVVCPHCAEATELTPEERQALGADPGPDLKPRRGAGCRKCRLTGYLGRTAVFEMLPMPLQARLMVSHGASAEEIDQAIRGGMGLPRLRESGARLVARGITTVDEVVRATAD